VDLVPTLEVFRPKLLSGCLDLAPVAVDVLMEYLEELPRELLGFLLLVGKLLLGRLAIFSPQEMEVEEVVDLRTLIVVDLLVLADRFETDF